MSCQVENLRQGGLLLAGRVYAPFSRSHDLKEEEKKPSEPGTSHTIINRVEYGGRVHLCLLKSFLDVVQDVTVDKVEQLLLWLGSI